MDDKAATALDSIKWALKERKQAEERLTRYVVQARNGGASWAEIAQELRTSKQAAQQKYSKITLEDLPPASRPIDATAPAEALKADAVDGPSVTPSIFVDQQAPAPSRLIDGIALKAQGTKKPFQPTHRLMGWNGGK